MSQNIASETESVDLAETSNMEVAARQRHQVVLIRCLTKVFWGVVAMLIVAGFFIYYIYRTTQIEPVFYQAILLESPAELEVAGDQFETRIIEMQNQVQQNLDWSSVLKEKEINGWLAIDCPSKFPELIPPRLSQPRVQIQDSEIRLAFRYRTSRFSVIVTFAGDIFVADDTGEIAIRIKQARSGIIPIPIAKLADRMTAHLRKSGFDVTWTQIENDPVALLRIPHDKFQLADQAIRIESIVCRDQQLELVGSSIANH